jgi:hypothetical protein
MRLRLHHTPYISRRVARDLANSPFVDIRRTKDEIAIEVERIMDEDIENELDLDEKVAELLEEKEEEIEFYNADYKTLFWMTKKRLANEAGVILNFEDRFNHIAHEILDFLWEEDYIHYTVSDNQIKNIIFQSLDKFVQGFDEADSAVYEKLRNYKRKLIPGTEDYNLIYQRLYEEELLKRGLI